MLSALVLVAAFLLSASAQDIYISGHWQLCDLLIESYAVVLNATDYPSASSACKSFGMDLAEAPHFEKSTEQSIVGSLLLDCAFLGGLQVTAGWVLSEGEPDCFAVDVTGSVVSGSFSSCKDGRLLPVCRRRSPGQKPQGTIKAPVKKPSSKPQSTHSSAGKPPFNNTVDIPEDRPTVSESIPVYSVPMCPGAVALPTCGLSLLGFKVIPQPMPYAEAECACRALGMKVVDAGFLSFWPAAFLTFNCGAKGNLAWIDSSPDSNLANPPYNGSNGCMAMKAEKLALLGPRIEPQPCSRPLSVVCQGPILSGWRELAPLFGLMGLEGVDEALQSFYPIPRLPSVNDLARFIPIKMAALDLCASGKYEVVELKAGETASEVCAHKKMTLADPSGFQKAALAKFASSCSKIPVSGAVLRAPSQDQCQFIDKIGNVYNVKKENAVFQACSSPSAVICERV